MTQLAEFFKKYLNVSVADIWITDIVEVAIIAFLIYEIMLWIKNSRAWMLLRGFLVLFAFVAIAAIFEMDTILWIADKVFNIGVLALVIIFQPELRKALEQLGQNNMFAHLIQTNSLKKQDNTGEQVIDEIVKAAFEMGKARTGALIVLEKEFPLNEYISTGIKIDGLLTSQLLLNIFEHNTPLHDGAVIVRGNRVVSATCYLPLSDSMRISKALGTRHRAGLGISEVTDSVTVIVSEETGYVSVAQDGRLNRHMNAEALKNLLMASFAEPEEEAPRRKLLKGRQKHERKADKKADKKAD